MPYSSNTSDTNKYKFTKNSEASWSIDETSHSQPRRGALNPNSREAIQLKTCYTESIKPDCTEHLKPDSLTATQEPKPTFCCLNEPHCGTYNQLEQGPSQEEKHRAVLEYYMQHTITDYYYEQIMQQQNISLYMPINKIGYQYQPKIENEHRFDLPIKKPVPVSRAKSESTKDFKKNMYHQ